MAVIRTMADHEG